MKRVSGEVTMELYEGSLSAKERFSESEVKEIASSAVDDVCTGAVWAGDKVVVGVKRAGTAINDTIEENPRLSIVKR